MHGVFLIISLFQISERSLLVALTSLCLVAEFVVRIAEDDIEIWVFEALVIIGKYVIFKKIDNPLRIFFIAVATINHILQLHLYRHRAAFFQAFLNKIVVKVIVVGVIISKRKHLCQRGAGVIVAVFDSRIEKFMSLVGGVVFRLHHEMIATEDVLCVAIAVIRHPLNLLKLIFCETEQTRIDISIFQNILVKLLFFLLIFFIIFVLILVFILRIIIGKILVINVFYQLVDDFLIVDAVLLGETRNVDTLVLINLTVNHHHEDHVFQKLICLFHRIGYDGFKFGLVDILPNLDAFVEFLFGKPQILGYIHDYIFFVFRDISVNSRDGHKVHDMSHPCVFR